MDVKISFAPGAINFVEPQTFYKFDCIVCDRRIRTYTKPRDVFVKRSSFTVSPQPICKDCDEAMPALKEVEYL